ncbi:hypothetical protein HYFRA_00014218 [Hymenoscyphus fraxineus]|uniref:DUF6594 domain-containing protein n=1 Tax=Hymenoscyphus fraxineus TaxID=746836 RepID=A0A9N9Q0T7_9HELO|nr:hypothetical protein HYFRA_00014218 [Hymenoscyphus fraxineus]
MNNADATQTGAPKRNASSQTNTALELGNCTRKPINGFPRVAQKLASDPDRTTTLFRRFDPLSSRNLLFLEAELSELETLQNKADQDDGELLIPRR